MLLLAVAQNRAVAVADLILSLSLTTLGSDEPSFVHDIGGSCRATPPSSERDPRGRGSGRSAAHLVPAGHPAPAGLRARREDALQADSIARTLDPDLDPVKPLQEDGLDVIREEAGRRLEPCAFASYAYTQLDAVARLPRRLATVVDRSSPGR